MASNPRFIFLMSRRFGAEVFSIRSRQEMQSFSNREKAEKHIRSQIDGWQEVEPSTEYRIAFSGDKIDGYPEGLPHA